MISYVFVNDESGSRVNLSVAEMESYVTSGYWFQWLGVLEPGGVYVYEKWYDAEAYHQTPLASAYAAALWEGWDAFKEDGISSIADFWLWLAKGAGSSLNALGRRLRFWGSYLATEGRGASDAPGDPYYVGSPQNWYNNGMPGHEGEAEATLPDFGDNPFGGGLGELGAPTANGSSDDGSMVPAILAVAGIAWLVFKG